MGSCSVFILGWRLLQSRRKKIAKPARKIKAIPPITPPTITPVLLAENFKEPEAAVVDNASDIVDDVELDWAVEEGEGFGGASIVGMEELDEVVVAEGLVAAANKCSVVAARPQAM